MNGWSWIMLHNFLNPLKQATVSLSGPPGSIPLATVFCSVQCTLFCPNFWGKNKDVHYTWQNIASDPRPSTSNNQPTLTAWLCLGISKPRKCSSHLRLFYSSCSGDQAKHKWGLTSAWATQEIARTAHPVDSYRPCWSTTILSLHSWSSMESGG